MKKKSNILEAIMKQKIINCLKSYFDYLPERRAIAKMKTKIFIAINHNLFLFNYNFI